MTEQAERNQPVPAFNPEHQTGFGMKQISIEGQEMIVHDTNNFAVVFESFLRYRAGDTPRHFLELQYIAELAKPEHRIDYVMRIFVEQHPELFQQLVDIMYDRETEYDNRQKIYLATAGGNPKLQNLHGPAPSKEEHDRRGYYYSKAFDALADIAMELDADYDTEFFCR
jgi:hypothetical protein